MAGILRRGGHATAAVNFQLLARIWNASYLTAPSSAQPSLKSTSASQLEIPGQRARHSHCLVPANATSIDADNDAAACPAGDPALS